MKDEILLRGLLGVIKQPVFAKDKNLIYTFCNQAFADILGKSKNEIVGKTVFQLYEKELAEIYQKADENLLETGGSQDYETAIRFYDGSIHAVILHKNIILDEEENKLGIIGLVEDISSLKKKEKELIESESKYKKIFENVQDIFYQVDVNGNILEISPSVSKYSDYTHTEIIGQPIEMFYANPEDRNSLLREIQEKGEALDFEIVLIGKNKHLTHASVNAHFIFDENGVGSGVEGTLRDLTERKQAEEKLKLSLSSLQATLDSTTDGILVVSNSGKITNYNKQFKEIFNIPEGIMESGEDTSALEFVLKLLNNPEQFISKVQYLYNHPETDSFDTLEFLDGRIIERYSCPQKLDDKPIGRVWSFRDVTVRKKAEQQVHLMAHTLKSINESISITDINNRILFVNAAFLKTYGYTEDELIGQDISMVRSSENDPEIANQILNITTSTGWQGELLNRKKDGTDFPIMLSTTLINNEYGEVVGMVGVAVDISDRKKSEKLLRESEEKYRNLIETMPDGVYRSTHEGKFLEINDAMVRILGYDSKEELMEVDIKSELYFEPKDRESLILKTNPTELDVFPMKKKDGTAVWIEDHGWYVKDINDQIIYHEGILRDVTERKLAEFQLHKYAEELQEMNATKDKFLSIIAHDLKAPFSSILGLSEILKNEINSFDIGSIEQYINLIYSTSKNTYRLLENLLDWARMQQGKMPFNPRPLILKELVTDIFETLNDGAIKKQIILINSIEEQLIIHADQNMIKTVIRNLVSNSIKYTSANGRIEVSASVKDDFILVSVKDNGTGIPKADLNKLFRIETSYSRPGTENEVGTGLGLILCEEFISKHLGKIWVESEIGEGSEFKFILPCKI
jgi:PAS domain S-box-containing protein